MSKMAKKEGSLAKNAIFNAILTVSGVIFPLITFPYISRVLTPSGTGIYDFLYSFVGYFSMVAALGIPTYAIKACAVVRDDKIKLSQTIQEIILIQSVSTVVAVAALAVCVLFIDKISQNVLLTLVISVGLFGQVFSMNWLCSALERYTFVSIKSIAINLLCLILMFVFVKDQGDIVIYAAITCANNVISTVTNIVYLKPYFYIKPIRPYNVKRHIKPIIIFFCFTVATTIYTNVDRVMIGFMLDDTAVGLYSASYKISHIILSVATSISAVLLPRLSYYIKNSFREEFIKIIKIATNIVMMLAIPSVIYFMFYADEAILLFLGEQYAGSVMSVRILLPTIIVIGLTNLIGIQYLVPLGKEKHVMISTLLGAVVDIIINAVLIGLIGIEGAAIGTLCAELSVLIYQAVIIRKDIKYFITGINYKTVIAIVITTIPVLTVLKIFLKVGTVWSLLISVACFGVLYLLSLIVSKNDVYVMVMAKVRSVLGKKSENVGEIKKSEDVVQISSDGIADEGNAVGKGGDSAENNDSADSEIQK